MKVTLNFWDTHTSTAIVSIEGSSSQHVIVVPSPQNQNSADALDYIKIKAEQIIAEMMTAANLSSEVGKVIVEYE